MRCEQSGYVYGGAVSVSPKRRGPPACGNPSPATDSHIPHRALRRNTWGEAELAFEHAPQGDTRERFRRGFVSAVVPRGSPINGLLAIGPAQIAPVGVVDRGPRRVGLVLKDAGVDVVREGWCACHGLALSGQSSPVRGGQVGLMDGAASQQASHTDHDEPNGSPTPGGAHGDSFEVQGAAVGVQNAHISRGGPTAPSDRQQLPCPLRAGAPRRQNQGLPLIYQGVIRPYGILGH